MTSYISVSTRVDVDVDVPLEDCLASLSDDQLRGELERRGRIVCDKEHAAKLARRAYEEMRGTRVPESLRDLFWEMIGKIA